MTTTCTGRVWPASDPHDWQPCGQPTEQTLCWDCVRRLATLIRDLADDLTELQTQLARQSRYGTGGGSRSAERPLPYDQNASDILAETHRILLGWAKATTDATGSQLTGTSNRLLLRTIRRTSWAAHPAAGDLMAALLWAHTEVQSCIDTPASARYLGPCGSPTTDGECEGDVYVVGNRVRCRSCGATHSKDEQLEQIAALSDDLIVNAADASGALTAWGIPCTPAAVRDWVRRGRLAHRGHDRNGHPTYALAEVRDLANKAKERRKTKGS